MFIQPGLEHLNQLVSVAMTTAIDDPSLWRIFPDEATRAADIATMQRDSLDYLIRLGTGLVWATEELDAFAVVYRVPLPFRTEPGGPVFLDPDARQRWTDLALEQQRRYRIRAGLLLHAIYVVPSSKEEATTSALLDQVFALADFHSVVLTVGVTDPSDVAPLVDLGFTVTGDLADLEHGPRAWYLERPPTAPTRT